MRALGPRRVAAPDLAGVAAASLVSQLPVLRAVRNIDVARIVRERSM